MFLTDRGVEHSFTRPRHPWTNGRIERLFRTFKGLVFQHFWMLSRPAQVDRLCADFLTHYNRDRPHAAFGSRTPDEVFFGRPPTERPLGPAVYFEGRFRWFRFG